MKIGLYGGTFDPIHDGHIYVAEKSLACLSLDKIIFVPNKVSPFKTNQETLFSEDKRVNMICEKLINQSNMSIDTIQIYNSKVSYTIDLIEYYLTKIGFYDQLYYLMGSDCLLEFDKYKDWKEILKLVRLVVVQRQKYDGEKFIKKYPQYSNRIKIINCDGLNISSTEIRKKLK
jgi:nicotinate-nucleotide adenylyltransferase